MKRLLPVFMILVACGSNEQEVIKENKAEEVTVQQQNHSNDDVRMEFADGSPKLVGKMVNGQRSGIWTSYHSNGNKASENEYSNGLLNGKTVSYYVDGTIRYIGYYTNNEKDGVWQFFNSDGTEAQTENFSN